MSESLLHIFPNKAAFLFWGDCRYHMQAYSDEVFHIKISSRSVSTFNFLDARFLSDCFQLSLARHVLYFILPSKLKKPKYRIMIFLAFF